MHLIILRRGHRPARYIGKRGWVTDRKRARQFASVQEAIRFCAEHDIDDAEIVVHFAEPNAAPVTVAIQAQPAAGPSAEWFEAEHNFTFA
jgi:hypothetical protein